MNKINIARLAEYSNTKVEKSDVSILDFIPGKEDEVMQITIWSYVFKTLCLKYNYPENKADAFDEMTKIMKEKEKSELENRAKISEQKLQYHEAMTDFMENHYPTDTRLQKKFKVYSNNVHPMSSHDAKVQAV